ncbi:hypothetical protein JZ751_009011 [Albula glossodonta]|uniref:PI-PLC Y-box domain-containing protein n=1 Tax=Albula glossodonta TaxID=121402 RepID=A0A8T2NZS9_9TELE|nr:hypothetical protein JZ751_009011 [Albula glossodonta]
MGFESAAGDGRFGLSSLLLKPRLRAASSMAMALNFQSLGLPMDLNNGRFQDNGGCGYILKPNFLRSPETSFDPNFPPPDLKPSHVLMKATGNSQSQPHQLRKDCIIQLKDSRMNGRMHSMVTDLHPGSA